jgi:hypothetical protein
MRYLHRPSPAMVVALIALTVALGGTSVAAVNQLAANSVGTSQLKSNAVTTPKIKNSAVNASKLASNAVVAAKIASNAVVSAKIASNAVTSAKIANATIKPEDLSSAAQTAGPQGPSGPSGTAGTPATALWASVDVNGTLVRNRGATSAQRNGPGNYQVIFNQSVTGCSYVATPGGPTITLPVFFVIKVGQLPAVPAGVQVLTLGGDTPFFLAVFC